MSGRWVVWSEEHGQWWRGGGWGYTRSLRDAGRYTKAEADRIVSKANFALRGDNPLRFNEVALPDPLPAFDAERARRTAAER